MRDITDIMNNYRECTRHLWNTYFRMVAPRRSDVEAAFRFDAIKELIFRELVLAKIGKLDFQKPCDGEPWPFLAVRIPRNRRSPALISRPSADGNKYWDDPLRTLEGRGLILRFIDYFDWDEFNYIDCRYYKVRIVSLPGHPNLTGRDALIETQYARVVIESERSDAGTSKNGARRITG
jgi:hypothetical protein